MNSKTVNDLQQSLGYFFVKTDNLYQALTHRSVGRKNNERLEFLGDAILSYIMASTLYRCFPKTSEGDMSRMRASLVRGKTLASLAVELGIDRYLILGYGEVKSGGANRESILSGALEAIIGSIFLDSNMLTTEKLVFEWYRDRLDNISPGHKNKDPKTRLQEHLQEYSLPLPIYSVLKVCGYAHSRNFTIRCHVQGVCSHLIGTGPSRRKAEQSAAKKAVDKLGIV